MFNMEDSQLELIIDVISGVPEVIFKLKREEIKKREDNQDNSYSMEDENMSEHGQSERLTISEL